MVADEIDAGSSVVDLCCGDCVLERLLSEKECTYTGMDRSEAFIRAGRARSINVLFWDGPLMDFPEADVICIQSSLYQFMPNEKALLEKMISKARRKVIIAEPVINLAQSRYRAVRMLARLIEGTRSSGSAGRLTIESLEALASGLPGHVVLKRPVEREALIVVTRLQ